MTPRLPVTLNAVKGLLVKSSFLAALGMALLVFCLPLHADRLFTCGFEENNLLETMWSTQSGATIVTTPVNSGTYALEIGSGGGNARRQLASAKTSGTLFVRFYFRHDGLPIVIRRIFRWLNWASAAPANSLELLTTGEVRIINEVTTTTDDSTTQLSANTWYRIELEYLLSDTVGTLTLRINGTQEAQITGEDTLLTDVGFFQMENTFELTANFDDVAVNDEAGTFQNSWPGPGKIFLLKPDGNSAVAWTPKVGTNWQEVDDVPGTPDDATTENADTGNNSIDDLTLTNAPAEMGSGDDPILVHVAGRQYTSAGDSMQYRFTDDLSSLTSGASWVPGSSYEITPTDNAVVVDISSKSKANIDSFLVGYKRTSGGPGAKVFVTAVWVNVEWIEATPAGQQRRSQTIITRNRSPLRHPGA